MKTLTNKQKLFLNLIINYYKINNIFPTINDLKEITNYKSYNTIYKYLNSLEKKNYIKYDSKRNQILFVNKTINQNNSIYIPFINKDDYLNINNSNDYKSIKVNDNYLSKYGIYKDDILIISSDLTYLNNKFVVIKDNYSYKIYKYIKKDKFHYLINNKENLIFENKNIIVYKVISLIRNI